jgi:hypothetical protein
MLCGKELSLILPKLQLGVSGLLIFLRTVSTVFGVVKLAEFRASENR